MFLPWFIACMALLIGCSKPPSVPELSHDASPRPLRLALDSRLTVSDIREIFDSLNHDGKLSALRAYLAPASDVELEELAGLVRRHLYQEAFVHGGLPHLIETRSQEKGFTRLSGFVTRWRAHPAFSDEWEALRGLLALTDFPALAQQDSAFLDSRWLRLVKETWKKAGDGYHETQDWKAEPPPSSQALVADASRWLANDTSVAALAILLTSLVKTPLPGSLLEGLRSLETSTHVTGFEGFAYGLRRLAMAPTKAPLKSNQLDQLFQVIAELDQAPGGIFEELRHKLSEPGYAAEFARRLRPTFLSAVNGWATELLLSPEDEDPSKPAVLADGKFWKQFAQSPSATSDMRVFRIIFGTLVQALSEAGHPLEDVQSPTYFQGVFATYVHAYTLTHWLHTVLKDAIVDWTEDLSPNAVWATPLAPKTFELSMVSVDPTNPAKKRLSPQAKADLQAVPLTAFAALLETEIATGNPDRFSYRFDAPSKPLPLRELLLKALTLCDSKFQLGDLSPLISTFLFNATRNTQSPIFLGKAEKFPNLLLTFHQLLLGSEDREPTFRFLFEDLQFGKLNKDTRDFLLGFYEDAPKDALGHNPLQRRVEKLLDGFPLIYQLNQPAFSLPAPMELYHRLVRHTPAPHLALLGRLLSLPGRQGLFGMDGTHLRYPALWGLVAAGKPLALSTYALGLIEADDQERFLAPVRAAFHESGATLHFRILRAWLDAHPVGVARWIDRLRQEEMPIPLGDFSDEEIRWARDFVESGELGILWRFLSAHGSYADLRQFIHQLKDLARTGALRQAFELLATFENPRVRELARVLFDWEASGELLALLNSLAVDPN